MPTEDRCAIHQKMLDSIDKRTKVIEEALIGTLDSPGIVNKFDSRIIKLEKFRKVFLQSMIWFSGTLVTAIIGALVLVII